MEAGGLITITWLPEHWADTTLPFARDAVGHVVTERDLDALVTQAHAAMEVVFGVGFDSPSPIRRTLEHQ